MQANDEPWKVSRVCHRAPAVVDWFDNRDGEISGASFVHLRSEPSIESRSLRWLPKGTKIRALEQTNGWVRVKITYVPPTELPVDAPKDRLDTDTGWIKNSVVQY